MTLASVGGERSTKTTTPRKEAEQLVVRGDGERRGVTETRIAQAVYHGGKDVLKSEELDGRMHCSWGKTTADRAHTRQGVEETFGATKSSEGVTYSTETGQRRAPYILYLHPISPAS